MSIFDRIKEKIFGSARAETPPPTMGTQPSVTPGSTPEPGTARTATPGGPVPAGGGGGAPHAGPTPTGSTGSAAAGTGSTPPVSPRTQEPSAQSVDIGAVLDAKQKGGGQSLDWRHSIVDLMKLIDLDSSLASRKELAKELNYTGDTDDSATMNIWLHKQVMRKLAENGGTVPPELRS